MEALQNRRLYFEVYSSSPLAHVYRWKEDNITQSIWDISEVLLGTLCFNPSPKEFKTKKNLHGQLMSTVKVESEEWTVTLHTKHNLEKKTPFPSPTRKKRKAPSLHDLTSHWLDGNSIPKIGSHYFWPGQDKMRCSLEHPWAPNW
jgi:hypothetical protein